VAGVTGDARMAISLCQSAAKECLVSLRETKEKYPNDAEKAAGFDVVAMKYALAVTKSNAERGLGKCVSMSKWCDFPEGLVCSISYEMVILLIRFQKMPSCPVFP